MSMTRIENVRTTAATWQARHADVQSKVVARLSDPTQIVMGSDLENLAQVASYAQIAYQVQNILDHKADLGITDGTVLEQAILRQALSGAQVNMNSTSEGERLLRRYQAEGWLEVAQIVGGF